VVLKIYENETLNRLNFQIQSIYNEIRFLHRLNHPKIIKFISAIDTTEKIILIMELFSSLTLNEYLKRLKIPLSEQKIQTIFKQIVNAIQYMHNLGIVHRDIKLDNLLINRKL